MSQPRSSSSSFSTIPEHLIPSIFEAICREKLDDGLQPSFGDITRVFTRNSTRSLIQFIHNYSDELFLIFNGLLQFKYLFQYDATFGENFYGLKRLHFNHKTHKYSLLTNYNRFTALILMLFLPYLRYKMENKFKSLTELTDHERRALYQDEEQYKSMEIYIKVYPYFDAILEAIHFAFKLSFLFGYTNYDNLFNWIISQNTVRIDIRDLRRWKHKKDVFKATLFGKLEGSNASFMNNVKSAPYWLLRLIYILGNSTKIMTLAVLFGFKWVEWFFMEEDKLIQRKKLPVPPPPKVLKPTNITKMKMTHSINNNICLMCGNQRINSSCIPSGYVFCYNCVFPFVQKNKCCPITKLPCTPIQIRRIYQ